MLCPPFLLQNRKDADASSSRLFLLTKPWNDCFQRTMRCFFYYFYPFSWTSPNKTVCGLVLWVRICSKRFTLALLFQKDYNEFSLSLVCFMNHNVSAWVKSNQGPSWCKNILNCSISSRKGKGSIVSQDLKLTENIWSCSERPWYFAGIFQIFRRDIPNVAVVPFNFSASAA